MLTYARSVREGLLARGLVAQGEGSEVGSRGPGRCGLAEGLSLPPRGPHTHTRLCAHAGAETPRGSAFPPRPAALEPGLSRAPSSCRRTRPLRAGIFPDNSAQGRSHLFRNNQGMFSGIVFCFVLFSREREGGRERAREGGGGAEGETLKGSATQQRARPGGSISPPET